MLPALRGYVARLCTADRGCADGRIVLGGVGVKASEKIRGARHMDQTMVRLAGYFTQGKDVIASRFGAPATERNAVVRGFQDENEAEVYKRYQDEFFWWFIVYFNQTMVQRLILIMTTE